MYRPSFAVVVISLLIVTVGVAIADDTSQRDGFVEVLVGDVVIGENEQRLGPMRAAEFDEDAEDVVVEINLTVLETHGIDVSGAEVDLTDDDVTGASLESATVEDEIVTLVFAPEDSIIAVEAFQLTGLDTVDVEATSDLEFDVVFSAGEAEGRSFKIIDPDQVTPTLSPEPLSMDRDKHWVTIERIQPTDEDVTVELDVTVLESHGVDADDLEADIESEGATIRETTVEDGVVTVVVSPATNAALMDIEIKLDGFDTTAVDTDERVAATDIAYEVRIEGDDDDSVDIETFDLVTRYETPYHDGTPSPQPDEGRPTPTSIAMPGFGPVIALIALLGVSLLAARHW